MTYLSNRIGDYWYISQGKTRIPGYNDTASMEETDVSRPLTSLKDFDEILSVKFNRNPWTMNLSHPRSLINPPPSACESFLPPQSGGGGRITRGMEIGLEMMTFHVNCLSFRRSVSCYIFFKITKWLGGVLSARSPIRYLISIQSPRFDRYIFIGTVRMEW